MPEIPEHLEIESEPTNDAKTSSDSSQFLKDLRKSGNQYIGFQSVLDALDLWNSTVKLYFDAVDYKTSAHALNDWLTCPIGATCFFLGAAFISTFAYLGNGVAKSPNQSQISKQADTYWPYLRDMLKGMKWTFKGTRSFMIVVSILGQYQLIRYLTPVGLGLGALSACNRMWNRRMVEKRKSLQEQNDAFRRQIKGINACFHEVTRDLVWDENGEIRHEVLKNIYAGSLLKIPAENTHGFQYYRVHLTGALEGPLNNDAFFVNLNEELDLIRKSVPEQKIVPRIYWDKFEILLEKNQDAASLFKDVLADKKEHLKHLLDPTSDVSRFIQNHAVFQSDAKSAYASATFSGLLNAPYYFLGLLSMVTLPHTIFVASVCVCSLFMALNVAAELYQETDYQRRLRISQLKANLVKTKRLLVIEWQHANLELIQPSAPSVFEQTQERFSEDMYSFSEMNDASTNLDYYLLKTEIESILKFLSEKHQPLQEILHRFLQADNTKNITAQTKIYLDQLVLEYKDIDEHLKSLGLSDTRHRATLKHCIKIAKYEQDYYQQYTQLDEQLRLSNGSVWWQGLRNGLVVFGAFNSLLMTIASMNALFGIGFTPMFFYVSIFAGLTLLFFTTLYTLLSVNPKEDNIADDQDCPQFKTSSIFVASSTLKIIDDQDIQASKNLLISENSEVWRQLLSGFKKGIKFLQTLSVFLPMLSKTESVLTKLCFIASGLVFSAFFALKGLRGLMRVDDEAYKNSSIYQFLTGYQSDKETIKLESPNREQAVPESPTKRLFKKVPSIFQITDELVSQRRGSPTPTPTQMRNQSLT